MKDTRKIEIRVGITVTLAIILLIWILGWAKNFSFDSKEAILSVQFDNIAGLGVGDAVMVNGVKCGLVEEVTVKDTHVNVKLNLEPGTDLRKDAQFSIMMLDLMGGKKVEIMPGIMDEKIDYSIIQKGYFAGDISSAMAMFSYVQTDLVDVIKEIKVTLISLNKTIADDQFNADLKNTVKQLNSFAKNINALLNQNQESITKLIETSNKLVINTNDFLENNSSNIDSALTGINGLVKNSNNLVAKLNKLVTEIETRENNVGKILYDDELLLNIKSSLKQVKDLTQILIDQLQGDGLNVDVF